MACLASDSQGFELGTAQTALIDLKANLSSIVDEGSTALLLLLDLSAAFDLVDHKLLIDCLIDTAHFSGHAAAWIQSFLEGRSSRVFFGESSASPIELQCGVPQGSCLSPTLFNVYTRQLFDLLDDLGVIYTNYADDTQVVLKLSGSYVDDTRAINRVYSAIQAWMARYSLALNDKKTELLIVGSAPRLKQLPSEYQQFIIAGCSIPVLPYVKTLGVFFDSHLNFHRHVASIRSSCAALTKLLYQLRPYLSEPNLASLARALVLSRIDYCNGLLEGTSELNFSKLQTAQNGAVRAVFGLRRQEHVTKAREALHWLPVRQRVRFKTLTLVHKCLHGSAPTYLSKRLRPAHSKRMLRSCNKGLLFVPKFKLQRFQGTAFDIVAPRAWNQIPKALRNIVSLDAFKRALKTLLFTT